MTDTMILTTLGGIWGLFQNENEAIVDGNLSSIQALAVILAAMLAAFSLIRTSVDYVHGDGRFGWQLMRPITILLLVMNFSTVCSAMDGVVNIFTREICKISDSSLSDLGDAIGEAFSSLGEAQADLIKATDELAEQEEWGLWKKIKEAVRIAASSFLKTSRISTLTAVAFVGRCVMELAFFGVQALAAGILALIRMLGPFIVALSIPEVWKGGATGWVARYIQVSMWVPTGYFLIGVFTAYFRAVCRDITNGGLEAGIFIIGTSLLVVTTGMMLSIPKIASWFINSSGSNNAQSGLERSLQSLGRHLIK